MPCRLDGDLVARWNLQSPGDTVDALAQTGDSVGQSYLCLGRLVMSVKFGIGLPSVSTYC